MAIKELKREWSPEQLDYVKHYLLHWERDVKDLPACCVGSRATVSETDHEYVCTAECGWVREEFKELVNLCPEALSDPDVKILYKPGVMEIAANEYRQNTDYDVVYFPDVVTVLGYAFEKSSVRYAIFPKATMVQAGAFLRCENLRYAYFPSLVEAQRNSFGSTGIMHADFPALETVGEKYTGNVFAYCKSLVSINMPKLKSAFVDGGTHFKGDQKLTDVNLPELECAAAQMFCDCSALTKIDLPKATEVGRYAFEKSGIETLILRSETVATLVHTNAFTSTPIASGTGYIYVPAALIEDYKGATNWSTYAAQFRAIEDYPDICSPTMDEPITKGEAVALIDSKLGVIENGTY